MKTNTGIWIDGNEAIVVDIIENEASVRRVASGIDHGKAHGGYGGANKGMAQDARPDNKLLQRRQEQEKRFLREVIADVKESQRIYITGPGEMKLGLKKALEKAGGGNRVAEVATAARMKDPQLVETVRSFFGKKPPRHGMKT